MAPIHVWLAVGLALVGAAEAASQCSARRASSMQFSVRSVKNDTGHRIVKVEVRDQAKEAVVDLSVDHWTEVCGEEQAVGVSLTAGAGAESDTTALAPACRPGYTLVPDFGCYKLNCTQVTWDEAQNFCMSEGGNLAAPESLEEMNELKKLRQSNFPWVGVRKTYNQWRTVSGRPLSELGFPVWTPGHPRQSHECADIRPEGFHVYGCDVISTFLCEHSL